jgi:hypothetical protein
MTRSARIALALLAAVALFSATVPFALGPGASGPANDGAFFFMTVVLPLSLLLAAAVIWTRGWLRTAAIGVSYVLGTLIGIDILAGMAANLMHHG